MSSGLDLVPVKPTTAIVGEPTKQRAASKWFRLLVNDRVATVAAVILGFVFLTAAQAQKKATSLPEIPEVLKSLNASITDRPPAGLINAIRHQDVVTGHGCVNGFLNR